jgi:uncharacterized protein YeaO (DUF488 family)
MKNKKTMHELAKEFPNKTYRELEKYRNADRQQEAQRIFTQQENEELKEDQLTESQQKQEELEPIQEGRNMFDEERKKFQDYKAMYEKEHELRQKVEKELADLKKKIDPAHHIQKARESGL